MKIKNWNIKVFFISFILALLFSYLTNLLSNGASSIIMIILIIIVIAIGIIFDMIGVAVLSAKESTFHAKSSKKIKGAKEATKLIKSSVYVSNFCNDIIGDVCGIISGGLGAVLAINLSKYFNPALITILISSTISAITVTGKALFKNIAVKKADDILFLFSKILTIFKK